MLENYSEAQIFGTGLAVGITGMGVIWVISLAIFNNLNASLRMKIRILEASREGAIAALKQERKKAFDDALDTLRNVSELRGENLRLQRLVEKNL